MATWKLSTAYKKNAVEKQFWYKEGSVIIREEGYRWGTFYCENDEQPDIDLINSDGYEVGGDYDWELDSLDDGCWSEWTFPDGMSEEEQERIQTLWDEEWYEGMESDGWSNNDTEYHFYGPLLLVNDDTGEEFSGLDENGNIKKEAIVEPDPLVTDWFPAEIKPTHSGAYQVTDGKPTNWPFPNYSNWDGQKWSDDNIAQWRGLSNDPKSE